eukprot:scaffold26468_cov58-Phaeocystis_antarctica.AAC.1
MASSGRTLCNTATSGLAPSTFGCRVARAASRRSRHAVCPAMQQRKSAVMPAWSVRSSAAPRLTSSSTRGALPPTLARIRGVRPLLSALSRRRRCASSAAASTRRRAQLRWPRSQQRCSGPRDRVRTRCAERCCRARRVARPAARTGASRRWSAPPWRGRAVQRQANSWADEACETANGGRAALRARFLGRHGGEVWGENPGAQRVDERNNDDWLEHILGYSGIGSYGKLLGLIIWRTK